MRRAWQGGRFTPLASRATVMELIHVLAYPKFGLSSDDREALLSNYLPWVETVSVSRFPHSLPTVDDPDDRMFLALALVARACALVTGDSDLLAVKNRLGGVEVMTPAEFADWLDGAGQCAIR